MDNKSSDATGMEEIDSSSFFEDMLSKSLSPILRQESNNNVW